MGTPRLANMQVPRRLSRIFPLLIALYISLYFPTFARYFGYVSVDSLDNSSAPEDPALQWQDNVFPFRNQTPWDISTDYPYPRKLEYEVTEGTWLRLDVHPRSGDIVFGMLGDLYCIPGSETLYRSGIPTEARPVLIGIPYDSDPRFSPEGDRLVFRSDAELGNENIWILHWKGCKEMDVRALESDEGYEKDRKSRLRREGRLGAQRVTNETYRYVTSARFHPSGSKIIASKWYTGRITIAASEGWLYNLPDLSTEQAPGSIQTGSGERVLGRTLSPGKTVDDYADQQIGPEQFIWYTEDTIIFAKNAVDEYITSEKDVHKGAFAIYSKNLTTGVEETLVDTFPGGASRPELSRDGRTLAFVRHVRDREVLVLKDLLSGTLHYIWDGLSYDFSSSAPGPGGPYPSFAFSPSDTAVIIWASGQIYRVPLTLNRFGEKTAGGTPTPIPFKAKVQLQLADTLKGGVDLLKLETQPTQRVHALKELSIDDTGGRAVFQAAGISVVQAFGHGNTIPVPVLVPDAPYYSPSFVPGANHLVLHSRWSDTDFTSFELADTSTGIAYNLSGIPMGRYFAPVMSIATGASRNIAFVKTAGDLLTGKVVATAKPGIYIGQIRLPVEGSQSGNIFVTNLRFVPSEMDVDDKNTVLRFVGESLLVVQQAAKVFTVDLAAHPDSFGQHPQTTLMTGRMSNEISVHLSTSLGTGAVDVDQVAFVEYQHVYLASGKNVKIGEALWAKPGNATRGLARLSIDGGHSVAWSGDGSKVFWLSGPNIFSLEVSRADRCASAVENDPVYFGISCIQSVIDRQEVFVEHSTDIARLKSEARAFSLVDEATVQNADSVVIWNATILRMETGHKEQDLIKDGAMVIKAGVISRVGRVEDVTVPAGATVIDAHGGYVVPGFIDVHAHWSGYTVQYPAKSWEMQTFLSYGVTTMHNPSSDTVNTFAERSRLESGQFIGPRLLTTGTVLFAGSWVGLYEEIVDEHQARNALNRIKAEGGPVTLSYKNYQLPSRASRQRLFKVARNLSMLCVPEGGANFDWDLTYIIDGMTSVEHNLPFSRLYDDVLKLFAWSGTGYTPTHVVNYGGPPGEEYVWANHDVPNDPKLRRFHSHELLYKHTESAARPDYSYILFNISESAAKMAGMGLNLHIGAHGEHPMGHNYHAEMWFTKQGGLSNYEVLKAATLSAAKTLGLFDSLGSLTPGKLADFLIYPPGVDLLNDGIERTRELRIVARGGRLWDASTMTEIWPVEGRQQSMPPFNAD